MARAPERADGSPLYGHDRQGPRFSSRPPVQPAPSPAAGSLITAEEMNVVDSLAQAWNQFIKLPVQHGDDLNEFRRIIHAAQEKVLARLAVRAMNPKV